MAAKAKFRDGGDSRSAINCTNSRYKSSGKLFFRFPPDEASVELGHIPLFKLPSGTNKIGGLPHSSQQEGDEDRVCGLPEEVHIHPTHTKHDMPVCTFILTGMSCRAMRVSLQSFGLRQAQLKHTTVMVKGIQGPIPRPLSIQESKQLLQRALSYANKGLSLQGIQQECCFHTFNTHRMAAQKTISFENELAESASPQGIQGTPNMEMGCGHFQAWLDNCRRYGLPNCDQQLQGIQTGRLTLSQVLADQEALIAEISEGYRKRSEAQAVQFDENIQGAQSDMRLPDVSIPCPKGVQGDDCVRFKLWLENCQRFNLPDCVEQLQGFQSGRVTLAQIFAQQDAMIKDIVQIYQQKKGYSTKPENRNDLSGTAQVGGLTESQLTQREKLKRAVKEYGSTVIIFHVAISLASLSGFYLAVSSGVYLVGILRNLGVGEAVLQSKLATGTGTFVVAYAVHKVFAPVRIAITLTATPFIVRYLRRIGALKPPKKVP